MDYTGRLVTRPYVCMSAALICRVLCPVPRTPVFPYKYDSTVTLGR
jgi:hypothetical protein